MAETVQQPYETTASYLGPDLVAGTYNPSTLEAGIRKMPLI